MILYNNALSLSFAVRELSDDHGGSSDVVSSLRVVLLRCTGCTLQYPLFEPGDLFQTVYHHIHDKWRCYRSRRLFSGGGLFFFIFELFCFIYRIVLLYISNCFALYIELFCFIYRIVLLYISNCFALYIELFCFIYRIDDYHC